jgi:hypothetical protein
MAMERRAEIFSQIVFDFQGLFAEAIGAGEGVVSGMAFLSTPTANHKQAGLFSKPRQGLKQS